MDSVKASRRTRERMWVNPRTTSHSLVFSCTICACSPSVSISVRLALQLTKQISSVLNACQPCMHDVSVQRAGYVALHHIICCSLLDLAAGEPIMEFSQPCHIVAVPIGLVRSSLHFPGRQPPRPQTLDSALKLNPTRWRKWP